MHKQFSGIIGGIIAILILSGTQSCHRRDYNFVLRDERTLRLALNREIRLVLNLDSILCRLAIGAQGKVYFDDMLWENISDSTKQHLNICLAETRNLRIVALPASTPEPLLQITARRAPAERLLFVGTVRSDCMVCDIDRVLGEFRLQQRESFFWAEEIPPQEIWR